MIDAATAILIPATPLGIAAGIGWMRCARMLAIARDEAAYWEHRADRSSQWAADSAQCQADYLTRAKRAEARAEQYASAWGRVMRRLRVAEEALQPFRTAQLRQQLTASVAQMEIAA